MEYYLKHFNEPLLRFSANPESANPEYEILWVNESKKNFLPIGFTPTVDSLSRWIKSRAIPKNRAYVNALLSKCNLSLNRQLGIITLSRGLSLNDCYWVERVDDPTTFEQVNLYDNNFNQALAAVAFTGVGNVPNTDLVSSPEFTTNGMLPKCWRRIRGKVYLYKGGTSGASNTGYEPYSELYAYQIASALGIEAVPYSLSKWKGVLCSACELFTSKEYSYVPVGQLVHEEGVSILEKFYADLDFTSALADMYLLDAIICNTDRHYGNFGFLVDNQTNKIAKPAPLFDHGNSLFNLAGSDDFKNANSLVRYANTLYPRAYDDFIEKAKEFMTAEHKKKLRGMLDFSFQRQPTYNLPAKRLKLVEQVVRHRIRELLS